MAAGRSSDGSIDGSVNDDRITEDQFFVRPPLVFCRECRCDDAEDMLSFYQGWVLCDWSLALWLRSSSPFCPSPVHRNFAMARGPINWSQLVALGLYW